MSTMPTERVCLHASLPIEMNCRKLINSMLKSSLRIRHKIHFQLKPSFVPGGCYEKTLRSVLHLADGTVRNGARAECKLGRHSYEPRVCEGEVIDLLK